MTKNHLDLSQSANSDHELAHKLDQQFSSAAKENSSVGVLSAAARLDDLPPTELFARSLETYPSATSMPPSINPDAALAISDIAAKVAARNAARQEAPQVQVSQSPRPVSSKL